MGSIDLDRLFADDDRELRMEWLLREIERRDALIIDLLGMNTSTEHRMSLAKSELIATEKLSVIAEDHSLIARIRLPMTRGES